MNFVINQHHSINNDNMFENIKSLGQIILFTASE